MGIEQGVLVEKLQQRQVRLTHIVEQRRETLGAIGSRTNKLEIKAEEDLLVAVTRIARIGDVKGRVKSSIDRIEAKLAEVETGVHLISMAQEYRSRIQTLKEKTASIEQAVNDGLIPESILNLIKEGYRQEAGRPGRDAELRKALLFVQSLEKEKTEKPPKTQVAETKPVVEISDEILAVIEKTDRQKRLDKYPVRTERRGRRNWLITDVQLSDGSSVALPGLNNRENEKVLVLDLLIENSAGVDHRWLTEYLYGEWNKQNSIAAYSLKSDLKDKLPGGWEIQIKNSRWILVHNVTLAQSEIEKGGGVVVIVNLPEKEEKLFPFSERELAILCSVIYGKNGMYIRHGDGMVEFRVAPDCLGVCQEIETRKIVDGNHQGQLNQKLNNNAKELQIEREKALWEIKTFMQHVVSEDSQGHRECLDRLAPQMQHLVAQFMVWEDELSEAVLYEFLASVDQELVNVPGDVADDFSCIAPYIEAQRIWDSPYPIPIPKNVGEDLLPGDSEVVEIFVDLTETDSADVVSVPQVDVEQPPVTKKGKEIKLTPIQKVEREYPELRKKINLYLEKTDKYWKDNPEKLIGGHRFTSILRGEITVTLDQQKIYLEKKYAYRKQGKDHHVAYNRLDAMSLLCWCYCNRGQGWNNGVAAAVAVMIKEEIEKRSKEKV